MGPLCVCSLAKKKEKRKTPLAIRNSKPTKPRVVGTGRAKSPNDSLRCLLGPLLLPPHIFFLLGECRSEVSDSACTVRREAGHSIPQTAASKPALPPRLPELPSARPHQAAGVRLGQEVTQPVDAAMESSTPQPLRCEWFPCLNGIWAGSRASGSGLLQATR